MTKYHSRPTNGYASKREAQVASDLQVLARTGAIRNLREQVSFDLLPADKSLGYSRPLRYIADFVYDELLPDDFELKTQRVVADAKGFKTPVYKLKKRLMLQLLGVEVREL